MSDFCLIYKDFFIPPSLNSGVITSFIMEIRHIKAIRENLLTFYTVGRAADQGGLRRACFQNVLMLASLTVGCLWPQEVGICRKCTSRS